jgi:hypothetical protein
MRNKGIANYYSERIHCHPERSEGSPQFAFGFVGPRPTAEILRCAQDDSEMRAAIEGAQHA